MKKVLILGGYGNFGSRIAKALVKKNISIIIAGRDQVKALLLQEQLQKLNQASSITVATFDANKEFEKELDILRPLIVINTIGPFQKADYTIAKKMYRKTNTLY